MGELLVGTTMPEALGRQQGHGHGRAEGERAGMAQPQPSLVVVADVPPQSVEAGVASYDRGRARDDLWDVGLGEGVAQAAAKLGVDPVKPITLLGIAALAEPDLLVEIEATVILD